MSDWENDSEHHRIGDIFVKFSPFFKMYTEYVKNFDHAINTINSLYQKNNKFQAIMDEIHVSFRSYFVTFLHIWHFGVLNVLRL